MLRQDDRSDYDPWQEFHDGVQQTEQIAQTVPLFNGIGCEDCEPLTILGTSVHDIEALKFLLRCGVVYCDWDYWIVVEKIAMDLQRMN